MKKVIGIGNALVDILMKVEDNFLAEHNLEKGSMQLVDEDTLKKLLKALEEKELPQTEPGGSAANAITGLGKLGVPSAFIGKVGDDPYGITFSEGLIAHSVESKLMKSDAGTGTGCALTLITPDSERTFATYLGAAIELIPENLSLNMFNGYDYFHIEGYLVQNHELIERACELAKEAGCKISIDFAAFNVVEDNLVFLKNLTNEYVDIIFANEEEAKSFTGKQPDHALEVFAKMSEIAVVKIGKSGSLIKSGDDKAKVDIIEADAIDTTGAGDLYAAGFLYGLVHGYDLEKCGKIAAITAGKVVEVIGAKMSDSVWSEINNMIEDL